MAYQVQQRRAEELAELDRAKTTFFSNISHEFRTPLALILGPVEELRASLAAGDAAARDAGPLAAREELEVVHRNALRLGKLVNTLLDFSRIEGRPHGGPVRAGQPGGLHGRPGQRLPLGDRPGRPGLPGGLP